MPAREGVDALIVQGDHSRYDDVARNFEAVKRHYRTDRRAGQQRGDLPANRSARHPARRVGSGDERQSARAVTACYAFRRTDDARRKDRRGDRQHRRQRRLGSVGIAPASWHLESRGDHADRGDGGGARAVPDSRQLPRAGSDHPLDRAESAKLARDRGAAAAPALRRRGRRGARGDLPGDQRLHHGIGAARRWRRVAGVKEVILGSCRRGLSCQPILIVRLLSQIVFIAPASSGK